MTELIHAYPTTSQGLYGCVTACEIRGDGRTSPIVKCSRDRDAVTCETCKAAMPVEKHSPFEIGVASYWRSRRAGETESHAIELAVCDTLDAVAAEQSPAPFHNQLS